MRIRSVGREMVERMNRESDRLWRKRERERRKAFRAGVARMVRRAG